MATDSWVCPLTAVASNGDVTQLYPAFVSAGVTKATSTNGQLIRKPTEGAMHSIQIEPDGSNGGLVEIWDVNGADGGADVSLLTVITNAQLAALVTAGLAKKIWEQQFSGTVGSGPVNASGIFRSFSKGLAARFSNSGPTGACTLNLVCNGGFVKDESRGGY